MLTHARTGRRWLLAAAALALAACSGCGAVHTRTTLGPPRKLVVAIDGAPSALYAPLYEGVANGDFARGALSLSVAAAGDSSSALADLLSGRAAVAIASEPALLEARASGSRLVAIGALEHGPLQAIISLRSHPIRSPSQLIGRSVAMTGTTLASAVLDSFLSRAGIPNARVRTIDAGAGTDRALSSHKAVASVGGLWNFDAVALELSHHPVSVIHLPDAGIPNFSDLVIVVRAGEARRDGALLRAFLQSLTRSERAVHANPQATARLLATVNPALSERFELAVLSASAPVSAARSGEPFGYQSPPAWAAFGDWMSSHGLLHGPTDAGLAITDEFLPGQGE